MTKKKTPRTFTVVYEPDEGGWHAYIQAVRGCRTFGKSLGLARRNIREALSTCVDVLGDDADRIAEQATFVDDVRLPGRLKSLIAQLHAARKQAEAHQERMQAKMTEALLTLARSGFSTRDAADVVGVSHQRVHQITADRRAGER